MPPNNPPEAIRNGARWQLMEWNVNSVVNQKRTIDRQDNTYF